MAIMQAGAKSIAIDRDNNKGEGAAPGVSPNGDALPIGDSSGSGDGVPPAEALEDVGDGAA